MAKSNKKTGVSPFWKPGKPGEAIEGLYVGLQATKTKDGKRGVAFVLLLKNGTKLVPATFEIHSTLDEEVKSFKAGKTKLRFEYVSTEKTNRGYRVKKFNCFVNGKLIEPKGAFVTVNDTKKAGELWASVAPAEGGKK